MAAIRPPFRAEVLAFDPRDAVFGGPACAVRGCVRPHRQRGLCDGHASRWRAQGCPDMAEFVVTTDPRFHGRAPLRSCAVPGCEFGRQGFGLCPQHYRQWRRVGGPQLPGWVASASALSPPSPLPPVCRVEGCRLWTHGASVLCLHHWKRWIRRGRPEVAAFLDQMADEDDVIGGRVDLRRLPGLLRLEIAYVLQCRRDEATVRLIPTQVQLIVNALAATRLGSLLEASEQDWAACRPSPMLKKRLGALAFMRDAYRRVEALAIGQGWDVEYPRAVWRLRNLGLHQLGATLDFTGIAQPWLRELAKRWARRQLTTGLSVATTHNGVRAVTWFAGWLSRPQVAVDRLAEVDRAVLERFLADLRTELGGRRRHADFVAGVGGFLRAIRQNGWDDTLAAGAQMFPDDYPKPSPRLPRGLPASVLAQVESPANLDRWTDPANRLITLILIRTGLRVSSAVTLPFDCIVADNDGAPYLRYWNTKMKREALVALDEEGHQQILDQQRRGLDRFPAGIPVLFPSPRVQLEGTKPNYT